MKRGPKSAASLTVVPLDTARTRARIPTPKSLTGALERSLFADTVANFNHLTAADSPLLCAYAQNVVAASKLSKKSDFQSIKGCEIKTRTALAIARALRITQISRTHPESLSRNRSNNPRPSYYDQMRNEGGDDE